MALPAVTLKENRRGHPLVETGFLNYVYRFPVEANGVSILLSDNIGSNRDGELIGAQLLKQRIAEGLVFQRRGAQGDERFP